MSNETTLDPTETPELQSLETLHTSHEESSADAPEVKLEGDEENALSAAPEAGSESENKPEIENEPEEIYLSKTYDLDIDFDTFSVTEKRAASIRKLLSDVKAKTWMASLKDWVDAEGQAYYPYGEQTEMGETPSKRIAWEAGHALEVLELINDGVDTEVKIEGKRYLCLQKLPKGDELLLSHFNPEFTSKFISLEAELHANLKVFLKAKSDKQKAFQERFKK